MKAAQPLRASHLEPIPLAEPPLLRIIDVCRWLKISKPTFWRLDLTRFRGHPKVSFGGFTMANKSVRYTPEFKRQMVWYTVHAGSSNVSQCALARRLRSVQTWPNLVREPVPRQGTCHGPRTGPGRFSSPDCRGGPRQVIPLARQLLPCRV